MQPTKPNLEELIEKIEAGVLADLSDEQVARLADALDAGALPEVADRRATPDPRLRSALDQVERPALPTSAAWDTMWQRVDAAAHAEPPSVGARVLRLWRPLGVAVAAGLMLAAIWARPVEPRAAAADDWPLRLARDVQINALEVSNGTPFVVSLGGGNGSEMIWVLSAVESGG